MSKKPAHPQGSGVPSPATPRNHFEGVLDAIIETTQIGLWDWQLLTNKVVYSAEWEAIAGYAPGTLPQQLASWEHGVLPDDLPAAAEAIQNHVDGKTPLYEAEFRMQRPDGTIIWAQDRGKVIEWTPDGTPCRMVGVIQDITRIKATEQELKDKSEQLDYVARLSGLGMWDWDLQSQRIAYSDEYMEMLGYGPGEAKGTYEEWEALNHPDDLPAVTKALQACLAGQTDSYSQETRLRHKDGHYVWTLDMGRIVQRDEQGAPLRLWGGHLNIDHLKRTELSLQKALGENQATNAQLQQDIALATEDLAENRQFTQQLFDANPYVNVIFNDQFRPVDCNPMAVEYFGFASKEELLEKLVDTINRSVPDIQPDGRPSVTLKDKFREVMKKGTISFETELNLAGELTPAQVIFKKLASRRSFVIAAYMIDLKIIKQAKNEIVRQDHLLRKVNDVATSLMEAEPQQFEDSINHALGLLAEGIHANRAYVWENFEQDGQMWCRQMFSYAAEGSPYPEKRFERGICYDDVPAWRKLFAQGECVNAPVTRMATAERQVLQRTAAKSILLIPIRRQRVFWGFIGFDDCERERTFTAMEEKVLHSAGMLVFSAILRNQVNQNLIEAREEAEANARAKTDFLSRMSHEIRTPMNAIIGMTAIARKVRDFGKIQTSLDKIERASQQLLDIINDILDMSKIESGRLQLNNIEFDFELMMKGIFDVVQVKLDEKGQSFEFHNDTVFDRYMVADELRLAQVMMNLLTNAVKFTPVGGEIGLFVRQIPGRDNAAVLHVDVTDTGIGIEEEQMERLFMSFEQGDGGITRRYGGTGLGLSICKSVVEMMGGSIWVESTPGVGSTFSFEVDIHWGRRLKDRRPENRPHTNLRVLVVDDNYDVCQYFSNILHSFGLACTTALSGPDALELVQQAQDVGAPYDVIFMDWRLPGMSGSETAREIMEMSDVQPVVVMISAADWADIQGEVAPSGITEFLPKPILPSALYNTLSKVTGIMAEAPPPEEDVPLYQWDDKHILLVEDVELNREVMMGLLADTGVQITCAVNGLQAVEMYESEPKKYDLILMDVQMPELDGIGATRRIRASAMPGAKIIPIVAMTANAFKEDIEKCLNAGMNDHVAKPVDVDALLELLQRYFKLNLHKR